MTIDTDIEIVDYCEWVDEQSWIDPSRDDCQPAIPFDMYDYEVVTKYGLLLQTYTDISCEMLPAVILAETAELTSPLPAGTVVCVIVDGYVYPFSSADEFQALMDEWREDLADYS